MLLARLAIATSWQGLGIRAFAVHAKDDDARRFYEHFGFLPLPSDPYHLFRLLKDIRAALK
jgi:hypothetical protein